MRDHPPASGAARHMWHYGEIGELFAIYIVNLLLKLVTFNIYHFWAKTQIRTYLWSNLSYDGDRFEYGGRGVELSLVKPHTAPSSIATRKRLSGSVTSPITCPMLNEAVRYPSRSSGAMAARCVSANMSRPPVGDGPPGPRRGARPRTVYHIRRTSTTAGRSRPRCGDGQSPWTAGVAHEPV